MFAVFAVLEKAYFTALRTLGKQTEHRTGDEASSPLYILSRNPQPTCVAGTPLPPVQSETH